MSMVSMSFEKRLTILPNGVVSKSSMGQRMILFKSCSCKVFEQYMQPIAKDSEKTKWIITIKKREREE